MRWTHLVVSQTKKKPIQISIESKCYPQPAHKNITLTLTFPYTLWKLHATNKLLTSKTLPPSKNDVVKLLSILFIVYLVSQLCGVISNSSLYCKFHIVNFQITFTFLYQHSLLCYIHLYMQKIFNGLFTSNLFLSHTVQYFSFNTKDL